jgi:hypothetical protein
MIAESLLGGIFGGLLRLAPEAFKFFDRKGERSHELAMLNKEMEFARVRGEIEMHKVEANISMSELNAIGVAIQEQGETARSAGWFVAALSALVRPLVTYWIVALYSLHKIATLSMAYDANGDWRQVMLTNWTPDDAGMLSMILGFYFVGRVWDRSHR